MNPVIGGEIGMKPLALISGGSSGIGLAAAGSLLGRGYRVVLAARQSAQLETARQSLITHVGVEPADVLVFPLDVRDFEACRSLVETIERDQGPIELVMTSAGMAVPGHFLEQAPALFDDHMKTNYGGTLALVHACAGFMAGRGRGHVILVSSGAAFVGLYGYAGYGASKFAVRGLAESLRSELGAHGIRVSLACPPDTDTPQYTAEQATKPEVTKRISAGGGLYAAQDVAARIVERALAGDFMITHGAALGALRWIASLYAPFFIRQQQKLANRWSARAPRS